ncbi:hypothetical protein C7S16_4664 [Burkholderia thailandensis]|uniref:Uncharacterized protein n=1 Tax=Burkholderia thailandensis TaxID=57975 RepID=A0AAW9CP89_BURTH|nr:hypothetical protein [Burkholderia thailandensis]MDW9252683.1 hypothetical protein [Burkholderia thailandensis]
MWRTSFDALSPFDGDSGGLLAVRALLGVLADAARGLGISGFAW